MTETICRLCGSEEMYIKTTCGFCKQPINFVCGRCGRITDEKVHVDCVNAEFFLSTISQ
jgi:predicted amidophosphoribosyltransferase